MSEKLDKTIIAFSKIDSQLFAVADRLGNNPQLQIQSVGQKVTTQSMNLQQPLSSLMWVEKTGYKQGLIICGQQDGQLTFIDADRLINNLQIPQVHYEDQIYEQNAVRTICQNFVSKNLLAIGGDEVLIVDLNSGFEELQIFSPGENLHEGYSISSVAWNAQVQFILASASQNGLVVIWNLKINKPITQFFLKKGLSGNVDCKLCWNPSNGTQIATTYNEKNCKIQIWDLQSISKPTIIIQNVHTEGVNDLRWNQQDQNLIMTSGKDKKICMWNFETCENVFSKSFQEEILQVAWGVNGFIGISTMDYAQVIKINFDNYAPVWLGKASGFSISLNNELITFDESEPGKINFKSLQSTVPQPIKDRLENLDVLIDDYDTLDTIYDTNSNTEDVEFNFIWHALYAVYKRDLTHFLKQLDINTNKTEEETDQFLGRQRDMPKPVVKKKTNVKKVEDMNSFFDNLNQNNQDTSPMRSLGGSQRQISEQNFIEEKISRNTNWNVGGEQLIKDNLVLGNIQNAIDVCFKCNRYTEAFIIAANNSEQILQETINQFYEVQTDNFLKNQFPNLVKNDYKQIIKTYQEDDWQQCLYFILSLPKSKDQVESLLEFAQRISNQNIQIICQILAYNFNGAFALVQEELNEKKKRSERNMLRLQWATVLVTFQKSLGKEVVNQQYDQFLYDLAAFCINQIQPQLAYKVISYANQKEEHICLMADLLYYGNQSIQQNFKPPKFKLKQNLVTENKVEQPKSQAKKERKPIDMSDKNDEVPPVTQNKPKGPPRPVPAKNNNNLQNQQEEEIKRLQEEQKQLLNQSNTKEQRQKPNPPQRPAPTQKQPQMPQSYEKEEIPTTFSGNPNNVNPSLPKGRPTGDNDMLKQKVQTVEADSEFISNVQTFLDENIVFLEQSEKNKKRLQLQTNDLNTLVQLLKEGTIKKTTLDNLQSIIDSTEQQNYKQAQIKYKEIVKEDWEQNKKWLTVMKKILRTQ